MSERGPISPVVIGFLAAGVVAIFALSVVLSSQVKEDKSGFHPSLVGTTEKFPVEKINHCSGTRAFRGL